MAENTPNPERHPHGPRRRQRKRVHVDSPVDPFDQLVAGFDNPLDAEALAVMPESERKASIVTDAVKEVQSDTDASPEVAAETANELSGNLESIAAIISNTALTETQKEQAIARLVQSEANLSDAQVEELQKKGVFARLVALAEGATSILADKGPVAVAGTMTAAKFINDAIENPDGPNLLEALYKFLKTLAILKFATKGVKSAAEKVNNATNKKADPEIGMGPGDDGGHSVGPDNKPGGPQSPNVKDEPLAVDPNMEAPQDPRVRAGNSQVTPDEEIELVPTAEVKREEPYERLDSVSTVDGIMGGSQADQNGVKYRDNPEAPGVDGRVTQEGLRNSQPFNSASPLHRGETASNTAQAGSTVAKPASFPKEIKFLAVIGAAGDVHTASTPAVTVVPKAQTAGVGL